MKGWGYELRVSEPARFRATGLDAAHRVRRRIEAAIAKALEDDPEVLSVEARLYLKESVTSCTRDAGCRADLHNKDCPKHAERARTQ